MQYFPQEENYTCGIACIRMMLNHFSRQDLSEKELAEICSTTPLTGTHPKDIISYLNSTGLKAELCTAKSIDEVQSLHETGFGIILLISTDVPHCVVYLGHNNNHLFLNDPWYGEKLAKSVKKFTKGVNYPFHRWDVDVKSLIKYYPQFSPTPFEDYQGRNHYIKVYESTSIISK